MSCVMHDLLQEKLRYFNYISAVLLFRGIDHGSDHLLLIIRPLWRLCVLSGCNYKKLRWLFTCQCLSQSSSGEYASIGRRGEKNLAWTAPTTELKIKKINVYFLFQLMCFFFYINLYWPSTLKISVAHNEC